jgi:hypothetical protein
MRDRRWLGLFCLVAALWVGCPNLGGKAKLSPVEAEKKAIEDLKALAVRDMSSGEAAAEARGLLFLEIEAQARLVLYTQTHPTEIETLSPAAIAIRLDVGRYLSEMRARKYHLSPLSLSVKLAGETPLGKEINRISIDLLMPAGNPSTQPGAISGQVNILRLYYNSAGALDVMEIKPPPAEIGQLSAYGIDALDASLEILASPNADQIAKFDPKKIKGFKRNIKTQKKKFSKFVKK